MKDITIKQLEVWIKILPRIEDERCLLDLSNKLNITYSHVHTVAEFLIKKGWVTKKMQGRTNIYKLTEKGLEMASTCNCLIGGLI